MMEEQPEEHSNKAVISPGREKRQSIRKALLSKAIFISLNVTAKFASTIDLSVGGLSVTLPAPLAVGQLCAISFDVPIEHAQQRALISGRVTSCVERDAQDYRVGIRFVQADATSKELVKAAVDHYLTLAI
jgi:hypothetical protein